MHRSAPQPATRNTPTGGRKIVMMMRRIAEIIVFGLFRLLFWLIVVGVVVAGSLVFVVVACLLFELILWLV